MKHSSKGNFTVYEESDICSLDEYSETLGEELEDKLEEVEQEIEESAYDDTEIKADIVSLQEENETLQTENTRLKATLPTTTGSGENITLSKTAELEFIQPPLPRGNSEQVQYSGKNKLNVSENLAFTRYYLVSVSLPAGTYKVTYSSETHGGTNKPGIRFDNNNITGILENKETTFTLTTDETNVYLYSNATSYANSAGIDATINQLMISTTGGDYEPYVGGTASPNPSYPQAITNVTGDVEVLVQNKNLFDRTKMSNAQDWATFPNGKQLFIKVKPNTQYTLSSNVPQSSNNLLYFNGTNTQANGVYNGKTVTQTSDNEGNLYVGFFTNRDYYNDVVNGTYYIQLEEGTTATTYTPHQEQTLPLTLGNIELCKIGTAQDYFYKENNKWYLYKAIGKVVLDGTEGFTTVSVGTNSYALNNVIASNYDENKLQIISNYFKGVPAINRGVGNNIIYVSSNVQFIIRNTSFSSVSEFKSWLAQQYTNGTPVTAEYELATPTSTEITDTTLISQLDAISNAISYEEQTNISGSSDESNPLFSVEAYQSIKLVLAG